MTLLKEICKMNITNEMGNSDTNKWFHLSWNWCYLLGKQLTKQYLSNYDGTFHIGGKFCTSYFLNIIQKTKIFSLF